MGSSGSGSFTDYPGTASSDNRTGGTSGQNRCEQAQSFEIEDVDTCDYFITFGLPPVGLDVYLKVFSRIVVMDITTNKIIGYVPTRLNYLAGCLKTGYSYQGKITSATRHPINRVLVDIFPI